MRVLIIEDGDEYLESLTRFVPGPTYAQARCAAEALQHLAAADIDVVYLDMRFDRLERSRLLGSIDDAVRRHNGNVERGYRYLANNQGLFILEELRTHGYEYIPVILAYDFSHELSRFEVLARRHPNLSWIPDAISPEEIRARLDRLGG